MNFLGIEVSRSTLGIFLCQQKYILDILKDSSDKSFDVTFSNGSTSQDPSLNGNLLPDPGIFRRLISQLLYLTVTRPDITYYVNYLSQFMQHPRTTHLDTTLCIFKYLKGTLNHGIFLSYASSLNLQGYTDSDWADCFTTRRSTTGYFTMLGSCPISWKAKK